MWLCVAPWAAEAQLEFTFHKIEMDVICEQMLSLKQ